MCIVAHIGAVCSKIHGRRTRIAHVVACSAGGWIVHMLSRVSQYVLALALCNAQEVPQPCSWLWSSLSRMCFIDLMFSKTSVQCVTYSATLMLAVLTDDWDGIDGAWSTFHVQVGTPGQAVRLLPGTSASAGDTTVSDLRELKSVRHILTCFRSG
jgi:hypothetical protein